jgi:hypothetical protein
MAEICQFPPIVTGSLRIVDPEIFPASSSAAHDMLQLQTNFFKLTVSLVEVVITLLVKWHVRVVRLCVRLFSAEISYCYVD